MSLSARRACAFLVLFAAIATGVTAAANGVTATMQVSVTVVRSCSVSAPSTSSSSSVDVTVECQRGAVDAMSIGMTGSSTDVRPVVPGPNRVNVLPAIPRATEGAKPIVITIDF